MDRDLQGTAAVIAVSTDLLSSATYGERNRAKNRMKYRSSLKGIIKYRAFPSVLEFSKLMKGSGMKMGTDPESFARAVLMTDHFKFPAFRWDSDTGVIRKIFNLNKQTKRMLGRINEPQGFHWKSAFRGNMIRVCEGLAADLEKFLIGIDEYVNQHDTNQGGNEMVENLKIAGQQGTGFQGISVNFGKKHPQEVYNEIWEQAQDYMKLASEIPRSYRIFQEMGMVHMYLPVWDYLSSGACRDPLEESVGLRPSTSKTSLRVVVARGLTKTMVAAAKQFKKDLEASASAELQSTGFCFSSFLVWT
jgi:hypothetical protein